MPASRLSALLALLTFLSTVPAAAQRGTEMDDSQWLDSCRSGWGGWGGWGGDDNRGRACEVRVVPVRPARRALEIDGRENGGIRVFSWDGDSVRVTARIQATARDDAAARDLIKDLRVTSDGPRIQADGAHDRGRKESVSVSYVVYVPRRFDLQLDAHNGSLGVSGVAGKLDLRTTNGSVALVDVGGDVRAHTMNGSLNVQLAGDKWDGRGLDAETQNGSVRLAIPAAYAAHFEAGTVNGRMNTDFPITVQGRIGRSLSFPLNGGGAPIRAITTNGSVTLSRR